jgi:hypothetical protein
MEISDAVSGLGGAEAVLSTGASVDGTISMSPIDKYQDYHIRLQRLVPDLAGNTAALTTPLFVRAVALVLLDALLIRTQAWTADSK